MGQAVDREGPVDRLLCAFNCLRMKIASFSCFASSAGRGAEDNPEEVLTKIWQSVVEIPTGASLSR
jgi:hypothetical protein